MTPNQWYAENSHLLDSQFEHIFFESVLMHVSGLSFAHLQTQMPFKDDDGKQRYCDFAISEGEGVRIAIEVDGYDKRGTGTGMSHDDFIDWQRRQAALTAQGWHVLRFANRDVCNEGLRCSKNIQSLLTSLRHKESTWAKAAAPKPAPTLPPTQPTQTPSASSAQNRPETKENPSRNALAKFGLPAGIAAAMVLAFQLYNQPAVSSQPNAQPPSQAHSTQTVAGTPWCPDAISWENVREHMGETITTKGPIKRLTYKPEINGSPTWIEIGARFPDPSRLTLLIWGNDRTAFEPQITGQIAGDTACISGEVSEYRGDVQIQLRTSGQLEIY